MAMRQGESTQLPIEEQKRYLLPPYILGVPAPCWSVILNSLWKSLVTFSSQCFTEVVEDKNYGAGRTTIIWCN